MINIKHFPFHLILNFSFGSAFILCQTSLPAQAQKGNQSDVTGAIVTSSEVAGGTFAPEPTAGRGRVAFTNNTVRSAVNQAARNIVNQLSINAITLPAGNPIPAGTQQILLNVLTAPISVQVNAGSGQITNALSSVQAGSTNNLAAQQLVNSLQGLLKTNSASPGQVSSVQGDSTNNQASQQLVNSLKGLLKTNSASPRQVSNVKVNPNQLVAAVKAYNNLINASSAQFLNNPPPELLGIRSVLSQLINTLY